MRVFYDDGVLRIRSMEPEDVKTLYETYLSYGWHPKTETYEKYYRDQQKGLRIVFIAELRGRKDHPLENIYITNSQFTMIDRSVIPDEKYGPADEREDYYLPYFSHVKNLVLNNTVFNTLD